MKILHLEGALGWGGQQIRICKKIKALKEKGYWIALGTFPETKIFYKAKEFNIPIYHLPLKKKDLKGIPALLNLIKRENINIIHTHTSWDTWVASIVKLIYPKFVLIRTRHISTPVGRNPLSWLLYNVFSDCIITTGEFIRRQLIEYNKFNPKKIISIPTGVDLSIFDPERVKGSLNKNGFLIGMISIFLEWKGHKYFILAAKKILKEIPFAKFYIIGDGSKEAKEMIEKQIYSLNLKEKVYMLGFREDIPQILASLDILVHPSYGSEGVPQVILQALAMKKPVIATNVGGIPEVIKNKETGLLIPPKDVDAIVDAVIELYKNKNLRDFLGKEGRRLVEERYSFDKTIQKIEEIYKTLLKINI